MELSEIFVDPQNRFGDIGIVNIPIIFFQKRQLDYTVLNYYQNLIRIRTPENALMTTFMCTVPLSILRVMQRLLSSHMKDTKHREKE